MNLFYLANTAAKGGNNMFMWIIFIALIAFSYFFVMRPQKKMQQQKQQMEAGLKPGDRVMMSSGLYGTIDTVNKQENTVVIDADGIYLTYNIRAIAKVVKSGTTVTKTQMENAAKEDSTENEESSSENQKDE
ncbi:preprotein translocase subunit YajC [Lactobacillus sp. PV034]|uniref:preprotein translocase subunit YajC n=1 Tax=Lactobacillus sp. PV034 TaxID=2594495 RepID=UPI00223F03BB|nr:preprotein translocase subunit YajC [Lactobacillus sp. PV034]QNQ81459.1 preprotein translocase subunit YajC [Lactobacillus sp. PV034]